MKTQAEWSPRAAPQKAAALLQGIQTQLSDTARGVGACWPQECPGSLSLPATHPLRSFSTQPTPAGKSSQDTSQARPPVSEPRGGEVPGRDQAAVCNRRPGWRGQGSGGSQGLGLQDRPRPGLVRPNPRGAQGALKWGTPSPVPETALGPQQPQWAHDPLPHFTETQTHRGGHGHGAQPRRDPHSSPVATAGTESGGTVTKHHQSGGLPTAGWPAGQKPETRCGQGWAVLGSREALWHLARGSPGLWTVCLLLGLCASLCVCFLVKGLVCHLGPPFPWDDLSQ